MKAIIGIVLLVFVGFGAGFIVMNSISNAQIAQNTTPELTATDWKDCYYTCSTDQTKRVYYARGEWAGQSQIVAQHIFIVEGVQYVSQSTPHEWSVTISRLYDWSDVHPKLLDKLKDARDYFYEQKAKMEESEAKDAKRKGA